MGPSPRKKAGKKTARKTAVVGKPFSEGHDERRGGGKKGRSGRPTLAFKAFVAQLRNDPDVQDALEATLKNGDSRHYAAALKVIVDYDDDLPANKLTPELRAELLAELRAEIAARKAAK